jgi:methanogenic corrinoid protein MtbC1
MQQIDSMLNISTVERDTGLSKDTLRMWERRYGFPEPARDTNGERAYPVEQVDKLRLIRRLMDRGYRPGKIVLCSLEELESLANERESQQRANLELDAVIRLIQGHQVSELRRHLLQTLARQGLQQFVLNTVRPLNAAVGTAWMRGQLAVFEEHLYTELMQSLLRNAVSSIQPPSRAPRVLLTTLPHELHSLGLLMVEALLAMEGAACISLGTDTPCNEIARAAAAQRADIVALSFSAMFGERAAVAGLSELRQLLPAAVLVWAGGACIERFRKPMPGVDLVGTLEGLIDRAKGWRALHASL